MLRKGAHPAEHPTGRQTSYSKPLVTVLVTGKSLTCHAGTLDDFVELCLSAVGCFISASSAVGVL